MVNTKICKEKMKKLKEQRKKELKLLNQAQTKEETPSKRKKNNKK